MSKEKYIGTKFQTISLGEYKFSGAELKIIQKLITVGKTFGKLGIKDKNGGNISARVKQGIIIKRTGAHPYALKVKDFVLVSRFTKDKVFVYGKSEPSSEARLHLSIYKSRPDIKWVFHCHDFSMVFCAHKFPSVGYIKEISYGTLESAQAVSRAAKKYNYLVQANHGVIALGKTTNAALNLIKKYHEHSQKFA